MSLDPVPFVRKWNASQLTERSAAQQHFRDLCEMLGVPHPTADDTVGANYTFEKRVAKTGGGQGFADVWRRGWFAWEYKSKGGDLRAAYKQLNEYHEALDNPPLLVVSDLVRFEVHTKFENAPTRVYAFTLDDLLKDRDTPPPPSPRSKSSAMSSETSTSSAPASPPPASPRPPRQTFCASLKSSSSNAPPPP